MPMNVSYPLVGDVKYKIEQPDEGVLFEDNQTEWCKL
jgi:hypothetical protein